VQQKEGDSTTASATFDRAIAMWRELGDPNGLAEALRFSGMTALFRGQMDKAGTEIEEALALFRSAEDARGEAWALQNLAWMAFVQGEYTKAEARLEVSAATFGEIGDWGGVAWALGLLAWVRFVQGRMDEARDLAERMEQEAVELGNRWAGAMMNVLLANIGLWDGRLQRARELAESAVEVFRELGDPWGELQAMSPLILASTMLGGYTESQALIDEIETVGFQVLDASMSRLPSLVRVALAVMTGDHNADVMARSLLTDVDDQTFINDEQRGLLGLARLQQGDSGGALEILERARELAFGAGSDVAIDVTYALALLGCGRPGEALLVLGEAEPRLVTFVDRYRFALGRAFALRASGQPADADGALHAAMTAVDGTESVLDRAIVRLAAAALWGETSRAESAAAEALDLLDGTGIRAEGWERIFAAAVTAGGE
jgi:tetratricopeptide (TPR) repeat protein